MEFPDGSIIQPYKTFEALIAVVKFAGADNVRKLDITCCADNLITKNPTPRYKIACKDVGDGWLCHTCSNTQTKIEQIKTISEKLNLGIKVDLV